MTGWRPASSLRCHGCRRLKVHKQHDSDFVNDKRREGHEREKESVYQRSTRQPILDFGVYDALVRRLLRPTAHHPPFFLPTPGNHYHLSLSLPATSLPRLIYKTPKGYRMSTKEDNEIGFYVSKGSGGDVNRDSDEEL
ncbi:hypothetical protein LXL04_006819 [Taraxacum kok-saghyz]